MTELVQGVAGSARPVAASVLERPLAAARATGPHGRLTTEVVDGVDALRLLHEEVDALTRACGLPATSRGPWVRARLGAHLEAGVDVEPWGVLVRDPAGQLRACAILVQGLDEDGSDAFVLASGGQGFRAGVAARDEASARALGAAVAVAADERAPWRSLELGPVAADDVAAWFAAGAGASAVESAPVPAVRRIPPAADGSDADAPSDPSDVSRYLSHGLRKSVRKAINRLATDGVTGVMTATREAGEILALAPALEEVYRARDVEHGFASALDDALGLAWWRRRVRDLSALGALELTTLHLDGDLAAYVLGLVDGRAYGILEGRFVSAWSRYSPGRLLEAQVLRRVLADDDLDVLDWMTSVAPETLIATTHVEPCVVVRRPVTG